MRPEMVRTQGLLAEVDRLTEELILSVDRSGGTSPKALMEQSDMLKQINQNLQEAEKQLAVSRKYLTQRAKRRSFQPTIRRSQQFSPRAFLELTKETVETWDSLSSGPSSSCVSTPTSMRSTDENVSRRVSSPARSDSVSVKLKQSTPQESRIKTRSNRRPRISNASSSIPSATAFPFLPEDCYQADYEDISTEISVEVDDIRTSSSGKRTPATTPRQISKNVIPSDKRTPPITPRQLQEEATVVKEGWLGMRDSNRAWATLWCILYLNGDFVYYTNQSKERAKGILKFVPDSTIHSFDDPRRMEIVAAHLPNSHGVHFRGADESERSAWSAAISQPLKYMKVMNMLRQ